MYYRYKAKKKDRRFLKFLFYSALIAVVLWTLYQKRNYLMFWKISHNRIVQQISSASSLSDPQERVAKLKKLEKDLFMYKEEHLYDPEAYTLFGRVSFDLGVSGLGSFTDMYVKELDTALSSEQRGYLLNAIKNISKAIALLDGREIEQENIFYLAKAYLLTGYYDDNEIFAFLSEKIRDLSNISSDNARFWGILALRCGETEKGLELLQQKGNIDSDVKGKILYSRALADGKRYTEAIVSFKKILENLEDVELKKIVYINLGKIYSAQGLFAESSESFAMALSLGDDKYTKLLYGKSLLSQGDRIKAKEIFTELSNIDASDMEVKNILNSLK